MLRRVDNWSTALHHYFVDCDTRTFCYGMYDCCLFAADGVRAMTGTDIAARWRGTYRTRLGALRCLKRCGTVAALMNGIADDHQLLEITISYAGRGDLVLINRESGEQSLGLVSLDGQRIAVPADIGITYLPLRSASKAWRI